MPADMQERAFRELWLQRDLVRPYANRNLRPVEVVLLVRLRDALAGRVLELGCGAGRLTGYLVELARAVHGLDVSASMIAYCESHYPGGVFRQGDMRDLSAYGDAEFDVVVAGYNVLDVLGDDERRAVLGEIRRLLAADGLLIMSSHNRAYAPLVRTPWRIRTSDPLRLIYDLISLPRNLRNHFRWRPFQRDAPTYAILNDEGHAYSVLHYYVSPDAQAAQFTELGFELVECLDLDGRPLGAEDTAPRCPELHYVARRRQ